MIFETLNNRGKPISELDKIKNSILYLAKKTRPEDPSLPQLVEHCWEHTLNQLMIAELSETAREDQLLRANWLYSQNPNARDWKGITSFKNKFKIGERVDSRDLYEERINRLYDGLCSYVEELEAAATAYCDVLSPNRAGAFEGFIPDGGPGEEVRSWAIRFLRVGVPANFLPLLMACRRSFTADEYAGMLELCEKMAFRTYVLREGGRSHKGGPRLSRLAYSIFKEQMSYEDARGALAVIAI